MELGYCDGLRASRSFDTQPDLPPKVVRSEFPGDQHERTRESQAHLASDCPAFFLWLLRAESPYRVHTRFIGLHVARSAVDFFLHAVSLLPSLHSFCLQNCSQHPRLFLNEFGMHNWEFPVQLERESCPELFHFEFSFPLLPSSYSWVCTSVPWQCGLDP